MDNETSMLDYGDFSVCPFCGEPVLADEAHDCLPEHGPAEVTSVKIVITPWLAAALLNIDPSRN